MNGHCKILRNCRAMLIPSGRDVILSEGTEVAITHCLGGYYTVRGIFGIARISDKDADAINPELCKQYTTTTDVKSSSNTNASLTQEELWNAAKTVYDPEIPVNIVDLGLVYRIDILKDENGNNKIEADMTLTAVGCAMGPMIADELRLKLEALPSVAKATVNIVWDPPWNQDMMNEEARMILGLA